MAWFWLCPWKRQISQKRLKLTAACIASTSEVVREALRVWHERQQYKKKIEILRARLELAEQSPLVEDFSMDDLIKELDS
jgi:hypothetical protein